MESIPLGTWNMCSLQADGLYIQVYILSIYTAVYLVYEVTESCFICSQCLRNSALSIHPPPTTTTPPHPTHHQYHTWIGSHQLEYGECITDNRLTSFLLQVRSLDGLERGDRRRFDNPWYARNPGDWLWQWPVHHTGRVRFEIHPVYPGF